MQSALLRSSALVYALSPQAFRRSRRTAAFGEAVQNLSVISSSSGDSTAGLVAPVMDGGDRGVGVFSSSLESDSLCSELSRLILLQPAGLDPHRQLSPIKTATSYNSWWLVR
jgi:hypothetical protein